MQNHINYFPITTPSRLNLPYRLVEVVDLPRGAAFHANVEKLKKFISREYRTPAVRVKLQDGSTYFAVVPHPQKPIPERFEVSALQGIVVNLRLVEGEPLAVKWDGTRQDNLIAESIAGFALGGNLWGHSNLWKGASPFKFYEKTNPSASTKLETTSTVTIHRGFSCRVRMLPGRGLHIALDVEHVYADTLTLAERIANREDWHQWLMRYFIYEFGSQWYFIQLQTVANHSISEAKFEDAEAKQITNVYDYTLAKHGKDTGSRVLKLQADDRALVYNYPHQSGGQMYGAVSLARLRYRTYETEAGRQHKATILDPQERMQAIQSYISTYLSKAMIAGQSIGVSAEPASVSRKVFPIPAQRFGNNRILNAPTPEGGAIQHYWRDRANLLKDKSVGVLTRTGITSHYILVPMSLAMDEDLMDSVQEDLGNAVNQLSPVPYNPKLVTWDDTRISNLPSLHKAIEDAKRSMTVSTPALALVILPTAPSRRHSGQVRSHIKRVLSPHVRTKSIQASEMITRKQAAQTDRKAEGIYRSYLFNTALKLLVTGGYWPWCLADELYYDLYIGIDVLNNFAAFTFVAAGGQVCRFYPTNSPQPEKLLTEPTAEVIEEHLSQLIPRIKSLIGRTPRHIVVHRDGRSYDTEQEGLKRGIQKLIDSRILEPDTKIGIVEIHKSTAESSRLVAKTKRGFVNPLVGSYHIFDEQWGIVSTTGFPGLRQGTAEPLTAKIVFGDLSIEQVLRDIYWLSILAWTKPDGLQSLPLTIKLADDWLEPIAANPDNNEDLISALIEFGKKKTTS